ncbi:MAG: hypothetical protein U9M95_00870 [Candidatus Altiarchaeota archaeon]|nr:hypothetical protein [Candidatus Altiarchaeota archaeon]
MQTTDPKKRFTLLNNILDKIEGFDGKFIVLTKKTCKNTRGEGKIKSCSGPLNFSHTPVAVDCNTQQKRII